MKTVILVDSKNLAYRSNFAHSTLRTKDGKPSGMLYGFLKEMLRLHKELPDAPMIFCWDGRGKTWRHRVCPYYKANRTPMPGVKEMMGQIDILVALLKEMEFHSPMIDGVEADDLLGMLATGLQENYQVRIYSTDRDMYQLISPRVTVYSRRKNTSGKFEADIIDKKAAESWLGAPLEAIREIRAMRGDGADNLKGLPGIGPVKAVKLWNEGFRLMEKGILHLGTWGINQEDWIKARQEYELATIITNPGANIWNEKQKGELNTIIPRIIEKPERENRTSDKIRAALYRVVGEYELEEVFKERDKFREMP